MTKDKKHFYFELLEYLSDFGIGVETNIKNICLKYADKFEQADEVADTFSKRWSWVTSVLGSIQQIGYIKYSADYHDLQELYLKDGNFSVSITKTGFDYINEYRLTQSNIALNQSTLESNRIISGNSTIQSRIFRRQTWVLIIASILALGSLIISAKTYFRDNRIQQLSGYTDKLRQDSIKSETRLLQQPKAQPQLHNLTGVARYVMPS